MTSALFLQIVTIASDVIIFLLVGFYLWTLQKDKNEVEIRQQKLAEKQEQIDAKHRQIIQNAHEQEKKIIDNATQQANSIISNAQFINDSAKQTIDNAFQKMIADLQNQAAASSNNFMGDYKKYLEHLAQQSVNSFQKLTQQIEAEMQTQMENLSNSQLKNMQAEIEEHKKQQLKEAEEKINDVIQSVAQKVFNKSISLDDHRSLIIDSLEKSRKEGLFE